MTLTSTALAHRRPTRTDKWDRNLPWVPDVHHGFTSVYSSALLDLGFSSSYLSLLVVSSSSSSSSWSASPCASSLFSSWYLLNCSTFSSSSYVISSLLP